MTTNGQGLSMDAQLGSTVTLQINGQEEKTEGLFIGEEAPRFVIVRLPVGIDQTALHEGAELSVSYIASGNVYKFQSSILHLMKKFPLMFITYPETYETTALRREARISCHIPATVSIDRKAMKGLVTDISNNGCRFIVKIPTNFKPYRVSVLSDILLSLSLYGEEQLDALKGKVRNTNVDESKIVLGIEFDNLEEPYSHKLKGFIERIDVLE
jgi:c-di-GMP-binding flagellar brake protein YcgR